MKKIKVFVCSHTHWDKEWYPTSEQVKFRLIKLITQLKSLFKNNKKFKFFNFDGQTIFIKDYYEIINDNELSKLLQKKKILLGPWFTQPDEFIPSGEALIKNLEIGINFTKSLNGNLIKVGYLPDTFGHISQMPQILNNFKINYALVWRGLNQTQVNTEFFWLSPDKSKVLTIHLPDKFGYGFTFFINRTYKDIVDGFIKVVEDIHKNSLTNSILFLDGFDHSFPNKHIDKIINKANKKNSKFKFLHSNLNIFFKEISKEISNKKLKQIIGELRYDKLSGIESWNYILPNVLSSRIYLKLINDKIETLLTKWCEPLLCYKNLLYKKNDKNLNVYLQKLWEMLVANHTHDSIGGCSTDEVHNEMELRYKKISQMCDVFIDDVVHNIKKNIDTRPIINEKDLGIIIFNNSITLKNENLEIKLFIPQKLIPIRIKDNTKIYLIDENRNKYYLEILEIEKKDKIYMYQEDLWISPGIVIKGNVILDHLPGFGHRVFKIEFKTSSKKITIIKKKRKPLLENEYYKIKINSNGTLNIKDKINNTEFKNIGYLQDSGDSGDEYTFSPPLNDKIYDTRNVSTKVYKTDNEQIERCIINYNFYIPEKLISSYKCRSKKLVRIPVKKEVILGKKSKRIEINIEVLNIARDHRLQIVFPTSIKTKYFYTLNQFDLIKRKIREDIQTKNLFSESPITEYPFHGIVGLNDKDKGLAIFAKGLREVEVEKKGDVKITLLRAVEYLSAPNSQITTRNADAGPAIHTPDAQMINRKIKYKIALVPYKSSIYNVFNEFDKFYTGVLADVIQYSTGSIPYTYNLFEFTAKHSLISVIKSISQHNATSIRIFNPTSETDNIYFKFNKKIKSVRRINFLGEFIENFNIMNSDEFNLTIPAKKIYTLIIKFL